MATYHENNDVALPHAGLLSYFHPRTSHAQPSEHAPPPYNDIEGLLTTPILTIDEAKDADERSDYSYCPDCDSFDCERGTFVLTTMKRDHRGFYAFCCFWCAVAVCILGAFGIFFTLDLVFSQFGMGTGLAMWMIRGNPSHADISYDMSFCLTSPNRQAPGPQTWRYIGSGGHVDCTTEVSTLSATASEQWKLRIDDEILFGDDLPVKTGHGRGDRFLHVEEHAGGDDLAEKATAGWWSTHDPVDPEETYQ
ncbi:hypothetical protein HBI79_014940 [Parastagonospora nodorum]|nr:hypothetical protein HBI79_014940 [Parastagonospora nodorum]